MEINEFLNKIESILVKTDFVQNWQVSKKRTTLQIRTFIEKDFFLDVFFNQSLDIYSFSLIMNNKRIWGCDKDNIRGWHLHPLANPNSHQLIKNHTIEEIFIRIEETIKNII